MSDILNKLPRRILSMQDIKSEFGNQVVADIADQLIEGKIEKVTQSASSIQCVNKIELSPQLKIIPELENKLNAFVEAPSGSADILIENDLVFKWSFEEKRKIHKRDFYPQWYNGKPKEKGIEADFIYWPGNFYIVHDCCKDFAVALKKTDENGEGIWILLLQLKHDNTPEKLIKTLGTYKKEIEKGNIKQANRSDTLELPIFNVESEIENTVSARYEFKGVIDRVFNQFYKSDTMHYKQKAYLELTENGWYGEAKTSVEFRSLAMPPQGTPQHYAIDGAFACCIFTPGKPSYFTALIDQPGIK